MTEERLPSFNLTQIAQRRARIFRDVFSEFIDHPVDGEMLDTLVRRLARVLPNGVPADALRQTLRGLAGLVITSATAALLSTRIAGNLESIKAGEAVTQWTSRKDEWMPIEVKQVYAYRRKRDNAVGDMVWVEFLAGRAIGMDSQAFWSKRLSRYLSQMAGFSRIDGKRPFSTAAQFVGLRLLVKVLANSQETPRFKEYRCPPGLLAFNTNLLKRRLGHPGGLPSACPFRYTHPCHRCAVGYQPSQGPEGVIHRRCDLALHKEQWRMQVCTSCHQRKTIDPEISETICVDCCDRARLRK